jgi:hypothetical protein
MAIMSLHWIWQLVGDQRHKNARPDRPPSPPMTIEVERLPDYLWRDLGFPQPRRRGETDHAS